MFIISAVPGVENYGFIQSSVKSKKKFYSEQGVTIKGKNQNGALITSDEEFNALCRKLMDEEIVGVDLEADSMYCFKEKICLIQLADRSRCFVADPLELSDFSGFKNLMSDPGTIKVFHGADFDIRSLDRDFGIQVKNLFDTEIACRFLGISQRGLSALLKKYFHVDVDKKFQKADWSKRPLDQDMMNYSMTDVAFLVGLYHILEKALAKKERGAWAQEEFERQELVRYENNHEPPLFIKFKGAGRIKGYRLAVLENLLQLRVDIARKKDLPLFKVFSAGTIEKLVETMPGTPAALKACGALSKKQYDMYGSACLDAVLKGLNMDPGQLPVYPKSSNPRLDRKDRETVKALKEMREAQSHELGIEPGFLLNNAAISQLVTDPPRSLLELEKLTCIRKWQVEAIGDKIIKILNAKTQIG